MNHIYLQSYEDRSMAAIIDPETFKISFKKRQDDEKVNGFATILTKNQGVVAIYADQNKLFFQHNTNRFDLKTEGLEIVYQRIFFVESFKIKINKKNIVKIKEISLEKFKESLLGDMDSLDEDSTYFLSWIARSFKKEGWVDLMINQWTDGFV